MDKLKSCRILTVSYNSFYDNANSYKNIYQSKEANAFEKFFSDKWKDLIKDIPKCKLRLIQDKNRLNTFNAIWEFPNNSTQNRVMELIKIHNEKFEGNIPKQQTYLAM